MSTKKTKQDEKKEIENLVSENKALRMKMGGYITSNKNYKTEIEKLNKKLSALEQSLHDSTIVISKQQKELKEQKKERDILFQYKVNYEYIANLPWWKRIFLTKKLL